jgi:plastocyanin
MFPLHPMLPVLVVTAAVLVKSVGVFATTLVVAVQTSDGRPLPGAVLTIHTRDGADHPAAPVSAIMDQVHRAFVPDLLVLPAGSTVEFPNSDSVSHQIYSFSAAKRFQLPLYRGKPYPPVHFEHTGVVTLGCNIHDSMLAYVVVTDAPYFGRTDATGSWSVELPRGTYRVSVWHPRLREPTALEREVVIADADRVPVSLHLSKPLQPAPLEPQHSWDSY